MTNLERNLGEKLSRLGADGQPPVDLAGRIRGAVVARRRRRRLVIVVAGAALVAVAVPTTVVLALGSDSGTGLQEAAGPSGSPPGVPVSSASLPPEFAALVEGSASHELRAPGGGLLFRADSVGPGGVLLGGTGYDGGAFRASDRKIWVVGGGIAATALTGPVDSWAPVTGDHLFAWAEHRDDRHDFQLVCADGSGGTRQISDRGVSKNHDAPIHIDGDALAWTDDAGRAWWTRGCGGTPHEVPSAGRVVAFAYPHVFIAPAAAGTVRQLDVETGASADVTGAPRLTADSDARFAATRDVLAWVADGRLSVLDRPDGRVTTVPAALPTAFAGAGQTVSLTVGQRIVAYSVRPMEGDPAGSRALLYDLVGQRTATIESEAFTAANKLAFRVGTSYHVVSVRQKG